MTTQKMEEVDTKVESPVEQKSAPQQPPRAALRSIEDIEADLRKPISKSRIRKRKQGGTEIEYIAWHDAVKLMSWYAAGWSYEVRSLTSISGKIVIVVRVTIPTINGDVFREATGQENDEDVKYGDPTSNAESMALRRAFAKFGLAIELYNKK